LAIDGPDDAQNWALDREFRPAMPADRERLYAGWKKAARRSPDWEP
jgi:glycerol kinase